MSTSPHVSRCAVYLAGDDLRHDFTRGGVTAALRPLLSMETFDVPAKR